MSRVPNARRARLRLIFHFRACRLTISTTCFAPRRGAPHMIPATELVQIGPPARSWLQYLLGQPPSRPSRNFIPLWARRRTEIQASFPRPHRAHACHGQPLKWSPHWQARARYDASLSGLSGTTCDKCANGGAENGTCIAASGRSSSLSEITISCKYPGY